MAPDLSRTISLYPNSKNVALTPVAFGPLAPGDMRVRTEHRRLPSGNCPYHAPDMV